MQAKVPFVLNDKVPAQQELRDLLRKNPYFVGGIAPTNEDYGRAIAGYAVEQGWKTCIVNTSQPGDPTDQPRLDAFKEIFEPNGGKILDVVRTAGTDGGKSQMENSLIPTFRTVPHENEGVFMVGVKLVEFSSVWCRCSMYDPPTL